MAGLPSRLVDALRGRYVIERPLGEGGMAIVYLADDLKHERKVALKVLKPEIAAVVGADRFLAEIKTTANLQHPHILPLFDSGEADGFLYYVMPYVKGKTLRERLRDEGQLPVDEAVHIATKVAEALDHAHSQGVVHRDVKPANILLHGADPVVSDFGIALAVGAAAGDRRTETGISLGTPHYMSPEQATGDRAVGPPSDIYALGCVLYEMLVGEPPFVGPTIHAVVGRILTGEPKPAVECRTSVPFQVDLAIRKALEKVPADRFRSAAAFADVLAGRARLTAPTQAPGAGTSRPGWIRALFAGAIFAVGGALGWAVARRPDPPAAPMRLSIRMAPGQELRPPELLRLSPDGSVLVYTGPAPGDEAVQLWALRWSSLEGTARPIPNTSNVVHFDVSPGNDEVALISGDSIRIQAIESDLSRTVTAGGAACCVRWSEDDLWLYFTNVDGGLSRVSPAGGASEVLTVAGSEAWRHGWPHPVPGSALVAFELEEVFGIGTRMALLDVGSGEYRVLGEGSRPTPFGDLILFTSPDGDELRFTRRGDAVTAETTIAGGIGGDLIGSAPTAFDVSSAGHLVYATVTVSSSHTRPVWVGRDGAETPVDPDLTGPIYTLRLSPDGRRLAMWAADPVRAILVKDLPDGPVARITAEGVVPVRPSWSPDGSAIFFGVPSTGGSNGSEIGMFRVRSDGVGDPERIPLPDLSAAAVMTRDGDWWIYRTSNLETDRGNLMATRTGGASEAVPLVVTEAAESQPTISRDGRWFAYSSDRTGTRQVYVRPFPTASSRVQVTLDDGHSPAFSPAMDELFVIENGWMVALAYTTEPTFRVTGRERLFDASPYIVPGGINAPHLYDVTADGRRFVMPRRLAPTDSEGEIVLILHAQRQLEALAGAN